VRAKKVSKSMPKILVVEDEQDLGTLLDHVLKKEGFRVEVVRAGREAIRSVRSETPDLVLLDLMLPDMSGLEVLKYCKKNRTLLETRFIIVSALKEEIDRVVGFELGADDYVVKPFSPRELILRIHSVLQRQDSPVHEEKPDPLRAGPIEIDLEGHHVLVEGHPVPLTLTEFRLLADLIRAGGRVRPRRALLSEVWGYDSEVMSRTVDTHIRRLRNKLGPAASWLATVRGVGYRIQDPGAET
jgi:two-component system phosphate regulon response regulator PhoB